MSHLLMTAFAELRRRAEVAEAGVFRRRTEQEAAQAAQDGAGMQGAPTVGGSPGGHVGAAAPLVAQWKAP